jgi:uncharacterized protein YecT (DUF1311 family)
MTIGLRNSCYTISVLVVAAACGRESPARTRADIAADSALAADLALANRDTLLVDSIGAGRRPDTIPAESTHAAASQPKAKPVTAPPQPAVAPQTAAKSAPPPPPPAAPARAVTRPVSPPRATARRSGDRCKSPAQADQEACLRSRLAASDMRMNRVYRALITEMRRQEGVKPGAKDPPSVDRLRTAQRSWLVYRDTECRRLGRDKEGALWAIPRSQCLGNFSEQRANELADNFSRITAH